MKNKFITKKIKKNKKLKFLFFFLMFIFGMFVSYKNLEKSKIEIADKELVNLVVSSSYTNDDGILERIMNEALKASNPIKLLNKDYNKYVTKTIEDKKVSNEEENPIIYIYNTHQTEEYAPSNYAEFSINPTVVMNDYILEDIFNKNGYKTLVEERSIKEVLNNNGWRYANSYQASRIFLEDSIVKHQSLKYFIDVHRDSLKKEKTTISINNKNYAKIVFLIGTENSNYQANLSFTEKINNKLNSLYPGLSKGIYKKGGEGVNGVYNQDFSPTTILVEMGGYENTTTEVLNTTIAFSKCFLEVLNEENT